MGLFWTGGWTQRLHIELCGTFAVAFGTFVFPWLLGQQYWGLGCVWVGGGRVWGGGGGGLGGVGGGGWGVGVGGGGGVGVGGGGRGCDFRCWGIKEDTKLVA